MKKNLTFKEIENYFYSKQLTQITGSEENSMKALFKTKSDLRTFILWQKEYLESSEHKSYVEFFNLEKSYKNDKKILKAALLNLENLTEDKITLLLEIANTYSHNWQIIEKIAAA